MKGKTPMRDCVNTGTENESEDVNVFSCVRELAQKYPAPDSQVIGVPCVSDAVLQFKAYGIPDGELRIGIPCDISTMTKWFWEVERDILNNKHLRKEAWTLRELVFSQTHRVVFSMTLTKTEVCRSGNIPQETLVSLRERAMNMFNKVFTHRSKNSPVFSFIPQAGNKTVDVIVRNMLVNSNEIQKIFSDRKLYDYIRGQIGMDLGLMEICSDSDTPWLSILVPGGKCGNKLSSKLMYDDLLSVFVHHNPCAEEKCYNVVLSKFVRGKINEAAAQKDLLERREKQKSLKRKRQFQSMELTLPGIDLTKPTTMDDYKVIDLFTSPHDPEYVLYLNDFICHVQDGNSYFMVKKVFSMTGQTTLMRVNGIKNLREMYSHLRKEVFKEGNDKPVEYSIIQCWVQHPGHLRVSDTKLMPGKPTLMYDDMNPDIPAELRPMYLNTWVEPMYKVLIRKYKWTEEEMHVPGPLIDATAGLNLYMEKVSKKSLAQRTYLEVILEHIFRVYCRKSAILFWAFNGFFYNIFERPEDRIGVNMVIVGNFGVGKSILIEALGEFGLGKGTLYHYFGGDGSRFSGRFNGYFSGSVLAFIDEAESKNMSDAVMKSQITESTKMTEVKFGDVRMTENYTNIIEAGNSYARDIAPGDRRAWCMECDTDAKFMHTPEVRDKLAAACGRNRSIPPLGVIQYIMWLKRNREMFDCLDFRTQPYMTAFKKNHMIKTIDQVYKWWRDVLSSEVQPKKVKSLKEQFEDQGAPMDEDDERSRWTGETTWNILWNNFRRIYKGKTNQSEFEKLLSLCVVLKEKPTRPGDKVIPHADKPLYFGCIAACWAQFDVFLTYGAVQDTVFVNGKAQHEFKWIRQLYISHYKEQRERTVGEAAGEFHVRCQSCCRCSDSWAYAQEHCLGEIRAEADKTIDDERKGILPGVFYKKERRELLQSTAAEVCHGDGERASNHGSSAEFEAAHSEGDIFDWRGFGEEPIYLSESSQSSTELWY